MGGPKSYKKLSDIPKKDIFQTPENYFDGLHRRIEEKIQGGDQNRKEGRVVKFPARESWPYIGLAVAASMALLIVFGPQLWTTKTTEVTAEEMISQVNSDDVVAYLKSIEMGEDEIVSVTDAENWEGDWEEEFSTSTPSFNDENIDLLYERYGVSEDEKMQKL